MENIPNWAWALIVLFITALIFAGINIAWIVLLVGGIASIGVGIIEVLEKRKRNKEEAH